MRIWLSALLILTTGGAALAAPAGEQDSPPPFRAPREAPDFLFRRPIGSVGARGSWVFTRAGSDWYDFVTDQLTIGDGDFNAPAIGLDVGLSLSPRLDAVVGVDYSRRTVHSEDRRYVDTQRLPINQDTQLRGANISGSLKFALTERGREVGRLAWVPRTLVPYVGAGGGVYWFRLRQIGDFVDYADLSVFSDLFESSGWTPSAMVFGGVDVKVHRRAFLTLEARYLWAAGELGAQWVDFDPLDLAGLRLATGINVTF